MLIFPLRGNGLITLNEAFYLTKGDHISDEEGGVCDPK